MLFRSLASPTATSSSAPGLGTWYVPPSRLRARPGADAVALSVRSVKSGSQAVLGKRRLAESGFQEVWGALRKRDEGAGEEYKPARRSRLWRVF